LNIFTNDIIIKSHKHTIHHKNEVLKSDICGCFYCTSTFQAIEILEWTDEGETALCPNCGIDSVIGNNSGYPVSNIDFLKQMHKHWF
jgi:transcription elongation factor Elf1